MQNLEIIDQSKKIISEAFERFERLAVCWTGGKDSTTLLWLVRKVCQEQQRRFPTVIFIDEGDVFEEILEFVFNLTEKWEIPLQILRNEDILSRVKQIGDMIKVQELSAENQKELKQIGYNDKVFVFEPESFAGNHLMKTVPLKKFILQEGIEGLFTAIRWSEHPARVGEQYFSPRENPTHTRIHPILHWTERNIWNVIHQFRIPFCKLYRKGYRSLGAKYNTFPLADIPAWQQDFEKIPERAGRGQNKEKMMAQLRALGYM